MLKKATSLFVAATTTVMMLAAIAAPAAAQAQSLAELQTLLAEITAKIAALSGGTTPAPAAAFTRSLTIGSRGADVSQLQSWLISKGYSIPAGATGYFGAQTRSAVAAYQAANGIAPAAGYFGPITMASVNAAAPVPGVTPPGTVPPPGTIPGPVVSDGVNGNITVTLETSPADGTDIKKGSSNVAIAKYKVKATDSDMVL